MNASEIRRGDRLIWRHDYVTIRTIKIGKGTGLGSLTVYGTVERTDEPVRLHYFDTEQVMVDRDGVKL